eukprot:CAMPEP_0170498902 /NCGR_PEP_ID=MMETSP0208-20121228/29440_1 /TAXON_ID=197538 /ORGANISM="Strombidium inclinatum, Strain S3" /LENGTH=72 /DNA_ID=CAMNT_0010776241 /DNA_START=74 /DNA_END=292 /DNA_ORIENTATION=-
MKAAQAKKQKVTVREMIDIYKWMQLERIKKASEEQIQKLQAVRDSLAQQIMDDPEVQEDMAEVGFDEVDFNN